MTETDKASIKSIIEKLKRGCVKSSEYYLDLFYLRQLKHEDKISTFCYEMEKLFDKGLPGLDEENRTRMLRSRLLSAVPETIKNYLEWLSEKKWPEIVHIFEKSVDYKEIYQGKFQIKEEVYLNKIYKSRTRSYKFNGTCSSGSFISPNSLPKSLSDKIENFIKTGNQSKCLDLRKTNLTIKLPPLIPGKFYLGNYFDLKEQPVHLSLTKLGEKYHHAFCINIFGQLMVVLNSREAIVQILSSKTLEYADRPSCFLLQLATNNSKDLVFSKPNIQWLQIRTAFHKFFSDMKKLHDRKDMTEIVFLEIWPDMYNQIEGLTNKKEPYEIKKIIYEFQSKILSVLLFGDEIAEDKYLLNEIRKLDTKSKEFISGLYNIMLNMNPLDNFLDNPSLSTLCQALNLQKSLMCKIFERATRRARNSLLSDQSDNICMRSIIDLLLPLLSLEKSLFTETQIKNVLTELIFAGIDGIVNTVNSFILYMCLNSNLQTRVYMEIKNNVHGDFVVLGDKKNLIVTEACIYETLRLVSQIPLGIFRKTVIRTELFGYVIPEETIVIPNLWKLHHDEKIYKDPFKFDPDRFIDAEKLSLKIDDTKFMFPFGTGKRGCPGKNVALNLIFLFVSSLVKNFEFKLVDDVDGDPRSFRLTSNLEPKSFRVQSTLRITSTTNLIQMSTKKSEVKTLCTDRSSLIKSIQENRHNLSDDES
ncbi:unnamed protein product [Brachionus calyciflorus]|uniref:Cytochrome p450 n=1 Tax=Brachionus calyciflorus TaxID=104777 RepID=A0A814HWS9_9BILA|nr:unnamed protein product [Brachionus calyciflorus]